MSQSLLSIIVCPCCRKDRLTIEIFEEKKGLIYNGVIKCKICRVWYKIENQIVDLLPIELRNEIGYKNFAKKWNKKYEILNKKRNNYIMQKRQVSFFNENYKVYDKEVIETKFYKALDRKHLYPWIEKMAVCKKVLVIGGGTGREAIPIAQNGPKVFCIDISEQMLKTAIKKARKEKIDHKIDFVLADAQKLPLKSKSFDAAICYGSLHHFPNSSLTIKEGGRILKEGGKWFSLDPNNTVFRHVFEIVMKIWKLYDELANEEPLFQQKDLEMWCYSSGIEVNIKYTTYILPHFLQLLNERNAYNIFNIMENISRIPYLKKMAGIIIAEGIKKS